ncbi:hypothetical protein Taro_018736 [Colocasia esculenta]|uniref:Uncharacterized protein n=1 Tax=Colocasia esculenta TaxID=4460 RepID=A0A843URI9_COLES|nr:hypothetical protein [Colocasia esculenta]
MDSDFFFSFWRCPHYFFVFVCLVKGASFLLNPCMAVVEGGLRHRRPFPALVFFRGSCSAPRGTKPFASSLIGV